MLTPEFGLTDGVLLLVVVAAAGGSTDGVLLVAAGGSIHGVRLVEVDGSIGGNSGQWINFHVRESRNDGQRSGRNLVRCR